MESLGQALFLDFFYALRAEGVSVAPHSWLALMRALLAGSHEQGVQGFYDVARCVLVSHERELAGFDRAFGASFGEGVVETKAAIHQALEEWLKNPILPRDIDPALREQLQKLDPETLRKLFEQRLREQKERHDGGNRWIGTGGTSPFGHGGFHPSGIRVGGSGGGRSAMAVLGARHYEAFDTQRTLDTRQMGAALRRLRRLGEVGSKDELDLEETIAATAKMAGELELRFRAPRKNTRRLLLLLDVGGSMDPHADLVSRLFSAAQRAGGFRELRSYYFHNCVYRAVYHDAQLTRPFDLLTLMEEVDSEWYLIIVGDAWMHPAELMMSSSDFFDRRPGPTGLEWLSMLAVRYKHNAWLNPEMPRVWHSESIAAVHSIFSMYHLSVDGLNEMAEAIKRPLADEIGKARYDRAQRYALRAKERLTAPG